MPLSDYVNFNPAPEATGGYNPGGLGVTEDQLKAMGVYNEGPGTQSYYDPQALAALGAANAFSFYNAANTTGITPFQAAQMYQTAQNPQNVYTGSAGVETNPFLGAILQQTSPSTSGLPANIFSGPIPSLGFAGAGANALYNLGTAGYNYLTGQGNMPLSSMTGGNLGLAGGDLALSQQGAPSNLSLATGSIALDPAAAAQLAAQQAYASQLAASLGQSSEAVGNLVNAYGQNALGNALAQDVNQYVASIEEQRAKNLGLSQTAATGTGTTTANLGGAIAMAPYTVSESTYGMGPTSFGGYQSLGGIGGADIGLMGGAGAGIVQAPKVTVTEPTVSTGTPTITPISTIPSTTTSSDITKLPAVGITGTPLTTATATPTTTLPKVTTPADVTTLSPVTVTSTPIKTTTATPTNIFSGITAPTQPVGPFAPAVKPTTSTATTTQTTATTSTVTPTTTVGDVGGGITYNPSAGQVAAGATDRNLARELGQTIPALYGQYNFGGKQGTLMDQYTGMYQNLLGQTMLGNNLTGEGARPGLTSQIAQQLAADQAKLQRIQSGQLAAEDVRSAQQAAREAYGARGQVMGQGAIGAEILNREAIRQQREDQARAAYQASMQNAFNATQLQTGNIFSPIGNLVGSTFNPLGAYPQDVYSSNVNAQLARDISAANNAAAIEAAKYGATAQKNAALTSAGTSLLSKLLFG